jgi:hypothetical protein
MLEEAHCAIVGALFGAAGVLAFWAYTEHRGRTICEQPAAQPRRVQIATAERWSLPGRLAHPVPLPVEGTFLLSDGYVGQHRLLAAWRAGIQAGQCCRGQIAHVDRIDKPHYRGRKIQNHYWILVRGDPSCPPHRSGIYDRWGTVRDLLSPVAGQPPAAVLHCAWPSLAEASCYWQGALLARDNPGRVGF